MTCASMFAHCPLIGRSGSWSGVQLRTRDAVCRGAAVPTLLLAAIATTHTLAA